MTWHIPTEFQIYLVAALAIALSTRYRRVGFAVILALTFQSFVMGIVNLVNHGIVYPSLNDNALWHHFRMTPFTRWYTLFIGVIWGLLYSEYTRLLKKNVFLCVWEESCRHLPQYSAWNRFKYICYSFPCH